RLCRGSALGRHAEPFGQQEPGGARDRGNRRRSGTYLREHDSRQTDGKRMNKKKFPKAVLRTADQMREAAASDAPKSASPDNVIEMMPKSEAATANIAAASTDPAAAL